MKLPSPPAILVIGLIIYSSTFFNNPSSEIPKTFSELFQKDEKVPLDVVDAQDLVRAIVISRSNSLKNEAEKTDNAKQFVIHRLYRLSGEISKFNQRKATISPTDRKDFGNFTNLSIDWLATNYVLFYLENGKYPESVIDDSIKGIPLEDLEKKSLELLELQGKNDGIDYITKFSQEDTKNVRK